MAKVRCFKPALLILSSILFSITADGLLKAAPRKPLSEKQIILYIHVADTSIVLNQVQLRNAPYFPPRSGYSGDMRIDLLSDQNRLLYKKRFESTLTVFSDDVDPQTGEIVNSGSEQTVLTDFIITLPDFGDARRFKVYRQKILNTPEPKTIEQLISTVQLPPRTEWEILP